jgi:hypothetical protein
MTNLLLFFYLAIISCLPSWLIGQQRYTRINGIWTHSRLLPPVPEWRREQDKDFGGVYIWHVN